MDNGYYTERGRSCSEGSCCDAYVKRKAIETIPFNHHYLDEMEVNLYACKYCWNDDCSEECVNNTGLPPPNGC